MKELKKVLKDKTLLILIDDFERYCFFSKIILTFQVKSVIFIHSSYFSFLKAKKDSSFSCNNVLLSSSGISKKSIINHLSIDEIKLGSRQKKTISSDIIEKINKLSKEVDYFIVFKGFQFSYYQLSSFIPTEKTIFFEIGNFPEKFQWSFFGVNAGSDHTTKVKKVEILVSDEEVEGLKSLLLNFIPPHVSKSIMDKATEAVVNKIGDIFLHTLSPQPSFFQYFIMAKNAIHCRMILKKLSRDSRSVLNQESFSLFIGQVEHDSQTVFQSTEVGISSLKKAKELSEKRGVKLIVRMHPGERNAKHLKESISFCELNNIEINNSGSLLEVVKNAEFVMTINSTGGVHSILFDKEVITFGDAFYKGWSPKDVVKYYKYVLEDLVS